MASPASSPRLPSPPPIAEDQIGPTSPGVSLFEGHGKFPEVNAIDTGASRRIRPGTKAEDMAEGPPLVEVMDIDSAFQLTEHLKALHYSLTHPPNSTTIQPINTDIARELSTPPTGTGREIWLYELSRFLIQKTNSILISLFADTPPCSSSTCPEMRASEWQYLCAVHDPPKSCAAIDYCCHTLDAAASTLSSSKMFPSRLGLGSGPGGGLAGGGDKVLQAQMKEIKNIFRRVYRIYAHAWFQHREMFWRVESKTGLYVLFKMVCDEYGIIEPENYTIPAEAEGVEPPFKMATKEEHDAPSPQAMSLLRRGDAQEAVEQEPAGNNVLSMGDTTKRHRHTMSDLTSSAANVIQEEVEPEDTETTAETKDEEVPPSPRRLDRQNTALKDLVEQEGKPPTGQDDNMGADVDEQEQDDDEEPILGVTRSETMRPTKPDDGGDGVGEEEEVEEEAEGEVTAIEDTLPDDLTTPIEGSDAALKKEEEEAEGEEAGEIEAEVKKEMAGEGEDAGKTVGD